MASMQQNKPVTYGDVFDVQGDLKDQPITKQDAAAMQHAETAVIGHTEPRGAASAMQSAADRNVSSGHVSYDAQSSASDQPMYVTEARVPGGVARVAYVASQPVAASDYAVGAPAAGITGLTQPFTVGDALEAAVAGAGDTAVRKSDVEALKTLETITANPKEELTSAARSAAAENIRRDPNDPRITLSHVLKDAQLCQDKAVTREDAEAVRAAELLGRPQEVDVKVGGIADSMKLAADVNDCLQAHEQNMGKENVS